jgi:hypothetical protein
MRKINNSQIKRKVPGKLFTRQIKRKVPGKLFKVVCHNGEKNPGKGIRRLQGKF